MAPLLQLSSSSQMLNSSQNEDEIVEVDLKWQSPNSANKSAAKSPSMPRRSDPALDAALLAMASDRTKSHSLSPRATPNQGKPKAKSLVNLNLNLDMSFSSFTNLVEAGISPPPKMPHRRTSTCVEGEEEGREEFYMDLNDKEATGKKKMRRVRRGVQRAFSDSELSEASTICSRDEDKKKRKDERKKNLLQRRKERLAAKFLGKGDSDEADELGHMNEEDDDVIDTDKDLEGFTGIALKKSGHSTHTTLTHSSHHTHATSDGDTVGMKKSQSEIDLETRSRVSKSPARFPRGSGQSRSRSGQSRGRARSTSRHGSSVATGDDTNKKKKKKGSSVSRTKRLSNRKLSSGESDSSDEEYEKERASSKTRKGSKSPRRRKKSKGARRAVKKGSRKPIQARPVNDNSASQRTWTGAVIDAAAAPEFVSPCTIGSGRRSVMDALTPSNRSRDSRVSGITMSTGMFSPNTTDDFSNHSAFTQSSLRGPQHIPGFQQIPDLEASERVGRATTGQNSNSLLETGNLSAVFETSSRTELGASGRDNDEQVGASTPRSSLRMPTVPRRRPSTDQSISSFVQKGPLFDNSYRSEYTETDRTDDHESEEMFDRFAPMTKQKSSTDLMNLEEPAEQRPTALLRKAASERNITSSVKSGVARVWRRGKKKPNN